MSCIPDSGSIQRRCSRKGTVRRYHLNAMDNICSFQEKKEAARGISGWSGQMGQVVGRAAKSCRSTRARRACITPSRNAAEQMLLSSCNHSLASMASPSGALLWLIQDLQCASNLQVASQQYERGLAFWRLSEARRCCRSPWESGSLHPADGHAIQHSSSFRLFGRGLTHCKCLSKSSLHSCMIPFISV